MDYFNFQAEFEGLLAYTEKTSKILANLKDLLNNYIKMKEQTLNSIKKSFDILLVEVNKPIKSSYEIKFVSGAQKTIKEFINILNVSLANEINQNNKLQTDIIQQINDYIKFISNKNYSVLNDFKKLINKVYSQKMYYEETKNEYIKSGKQVTIFEDKISQKNKSINSSISINTISTETDTDEETLKMLKTKFIQNEKKYKEIIEDTNMLYIAKNEEYFKIMSKFIENEESKANFFKICVEKYNYYLKNTLTISNTIIEYSTSVLTKLNGKNSNDTFRNDLNIFLVKEDTRIDQEKCIDYEIYKAQLCNMINKNRMFLKEDNNNNRFNITLDDIFYSEEKLNKSIFNQEERSIIEQIFLLDEIDNFKFNRFCTKIKNEKDYAKNFIDVILERYISTIGVQIVNENNFLKLEKILNNILLNNSVQKSLFELNFTVAYISEKTFYQDEKNPFHKIYLCKLLMDNNPIVKTKQFWLKLLKLKISSTLENKADKESEKIFKEEKLIEEKKTKENEEKDKLSMSTYTTSSRPSLFEYAGSMVSSFWYGKSNDDKQKDEIRKKEIYHAIYYSKSKEICLKKITEFSTHFACFCLNSLDVIDIISEITSQYQMTMEEKRIKYLIAKINSNMYSIKNAKFYKGNKEINDNNNNNKDNKVKYLNKFMNKNYLHGKLGKNNQSLILLNLMKYLPFKDYINILKVNKSTYKLISKILYKNMLMNVDEIIPEEIYIKNKIPNVWKNPQLRITIWKLLLNYKKVDYQNLVNNLDESKIEYLNIIKLDTKRMLLVGDKNQEEIKHSLENILSCLSICHPKINYSQGMNYIAYLLYVLCGSEEEGFQLFNCLLTSTAYGDLFFNELSKLNKYFYVFDRLIYIYTPEIAMHLKNKDLTSRYFASPWFITLFTNAYKNIKDQTNPKVLIWILDLFIINGWKSIIKIGLCLIKHFETRILSCDLEELLRFLINDVLKYDFFQNENYDNLRNIYEKLKIENALIENIEREYDLKDNNMK
jgi:hypothetical protein